jgi:DNA-binding Lrp family transcriptional regulator
MKLSKADESILQILEINGRTSNREVARQLNISEGMVRVRLKKMAENNSLTTYKYVQYNKRRKEVK